MWLEGNLGQQNTKGNEPLGGSLLPGCPSGNGVESSKRTLDYAVREAGPINYL